MSQALARRAEFHLRMRGMTGSEEACAAAARAYRVYHHKTESVDGDYLVDHSIIMYLIGASPEAPAAAEVRERCAELTAATDPAGDFVTFYAKNVTAAELANSVAGHVKRWVWPVEEATAAV